ncbi:unnamed protein product [Arabidopsis thaliana]|uniref:Uncharacterized protein n=1 Tax=Arabidopsis thaliana TaxID=3702 RepID=A0A654FI34_ARATH|nr:unnamed protein product [Arabidopsis thaliana]
MDIVANKLLMLGEEEQAALMDFDVEDDQNLELKKSNDIPKMDLVIYNPIDIPKWITQAPAVGFEVSVEEGAEKEW